MTRLRLVPALAALCLCACSTGPSSLPAAPIPTLDGGRLALSTCPTAKCLTVEVAPWCPDCRDAAPVLMRLRERLAGKGVATRFVVVLDKEPRLKEYAEKFGRDTAFDAAGVLRARGVPRLLVSDGTGAVLKDLHGVPSRATPDELAARLGLP